MSGAYGSTVLEHFRHPRNQGRLADADRSRLGSNPLCGDVVRLEVRLAGDRIAEARFTANACAICVAAASLLTEHVRGRGIDAALALPLGTLLEALGGQVPPGRVRCVALPLETLRAALGADAPGPIDG